MNNDPTTNFTLEGEMISNKRLKKIWRSLTNKPFPKNQIRAVVLSNKEETERVFKILKNSPNVKSVTLPEYGVETEIDEHTSAGVLIETYPDKRKGWLILISKDSPIPVEEDLKHELNHIAKGEITLDGKAFSQPVQ